jgi:hypothetical protein
MLNLLDRFMDWTFELQPDWVGAAMFFLLILGITVIVLPLVALLLVLTNGWILLAIPAFLVYAVYLAFNQ